MPSLYNITICRICLECLASKRNQFQEYFYDRFVLEGRIHPGGLRAKKIVNKANKETRIYNLQPLIASGKSKFARKHHLLLKQLRDFPKCAHDNGADALEMAISLGREKQGMQSGGRLAPSHCDHHDWHHVKKRATNRTLKAKGFDTVYGVVLTFLLVGIPV